MEAADSWPGGTARLGTSDDMMTESFCDSGAGYLAQRKSCCWKSAIAVLWVTCSAIGDRHLLRIVLVDGSGDTG